MPTWNGSSRTASLMATCYGSSGGFSKPASWKTAPSRPARKASREGLVSPVLSNIYLNYVLDLWFEKRFAKSCVGRSHLIRYADDYIACLQKEADARRFLTEMLERLAEFDLEVEPSKTVSPRVEPGLELGTLFDAIRVERHLVRGGEDYCHH